MANFLHPVRDSYIGIKTEGATPGTDPGAFVAGDLNLSLFGVPTFSVTPVWHDPEPVGSDGTTQTPLAGTFSGSISFRTMLTSSGNSTVTTVPAYAKAMYLCGMQSDTVEVFDYTSTTGTFIAGEPMTQAVSGGTANFIRLDGVDKCYIFNENGSGDGTNVWTGTTSGATVTPDTSIPADYGHVMYPDSTSGTYKVGWSSWYNSTSHTQQSLLGCRGTWSLGFDAVGAPGYIDFSVTGVPHDSTQEDIATPAPTYDSFVPIGFKGATLFTIGGLTNAVVKLNNFTMSSGIETSVPEDANTATYGAVYTLFSRNRKFRGSFNPLMLETAVADWFSKIKSGFGADPSLLISLGSVAGDRVEVYAPRCIPMESTTGDRDGARGNDIGLAFAGDQGATENEVFIITR